MIYFYNSNDFSPAKLFHFTICQKPWNNHPPNVKGCIDATNQ